MSEEKLRTKDSCSVVLYGPNGKPKKRTKRILYLLILLFLLLLILLFSRITRS